MIQLEKFRLPKNHCELRNVNFAIRALYQWSNGDETVGNVIRGLKGGTPRPALKYFAKEVALRNFTNEKCVVIPIPPTKVGAKDHSYYLAEEIAEQCGYEMKTLLYWKNKKVGQKYLKKTARFQNLIGAKDRLANFDKVILVDDLVTTGATVLAASRAIKGLNKIEVWALACRGY